MNLGDYVVDVLESPHFVQLDTHNLENVVDTIIQSIQSSGRAKPISSNFSILFYILLLTRTIKEIPERPFILYTMNKNDILFVLESGYVTSTLSRSSNKCIILAIALC